MKLRDQTHWPLFQNDDEVLLLGLPKLLGSVSEIERVPNHCYGSAVQWLSYKVIDPAVRVTEVFVF